MINRIEGIVTPVITPLLVDGSLDVKGLNTQVDRLINAGVAGIFILGTTGEGPALGQKLQMETIRASVRVVARRCPLLVGISAASIVDSIELGLEAKSSGADAAVAAPPCYLPADERELEGFFRILAEKIGIPLYIYNMPAMTKINMSPELIIKLAALPGIVGYKDSAGDPAAFAVVLEKLKSRTDFSVLMGPDTLMTEAVRLGANGGVNSGSNLCPELFVAAYRAARAGNNARVAELQKKIELLQRIYRFREHICCGVVAGLKAALFNLGVCGTMQALPARPAEAEVIEQIAKITRPLVTEHYVD